MLAWAQLHKKALLIGAGAVAVLVAVSIAYVVHATQKETAASKALSEISLSASPAGRADSGLAGRYLQVASDHPGTEGGARALLLAAATLYGDGKWTEAQAQYDRALREYGESQWAVQALYGRAACLDAGGNATEATAKYDEFIKRYATDPVADQARVSLARLYEKQNKPSHVGNQIAQYESSWRMFEIMLWADQADCRPPAPVVPNNNDILRPGA